MRAAEKRKSAIIFLVEDDLSDQELTRRTLMAGFHFVIVKIHYSRRITFGIRGRSGNNLLPLPWAPIGALPGESQ
jgi:hypothetical protein